MGLLLCLGLAFVAGAGNDGPELQGAALARFFPGPYFSSRGQDRLRGIVLTLWPGPTQLLALWRAGGLDADERVLVLLGAGAFHDRQLLTMYWQALGDQEARVRQAAVAGYRELIGDLPAPSQGPPAAGEVASLRAEIGAMDTALRYRPLIALWLDALAHAEGQSLAGRAPMVLVRPGGYCLKVIDRLVTAQDLPLLAAAYPLVGNGSAKMGLVKLIGGLTLNSFIIKPRGLRAGWGSGVWELALESSANFLRSHCSLDPTTILRERFSALGMPVSQPFGPSACAAWLEVAKKGDPTWWGLAAQQLYACGGPAVEISRLRVGQPDVGKAHGALMGWYRLR